MSTKNLLSADLRLTQQKSLSDMIISSFAKFENSFALEKNNKKLTYSNLFKRTNKIIEILNKFTFSKNETLAIIAHKNFNTVASILAAILNQNSFVLIDINLPKARQLKMIEDSKASHIIFTEKDDELHFFNNLFKIINISSINNDEEINSFNKITDNLTNENTSKACIFFTSGTTAAPKGIISSRTALAHYIYHHQELLKFNSNDRISQLANMTFDACLKDILPTLLCGACVCFPDTDYPYENINVLWDWLKITNITILQTVPSVLSQLIIAQSNEKLYLSDLRIVCLAGEPLKNELVSNFRELFGVKPELYNMYGPTETTILKTIKKIEDNNALLHTVGKPLPNCEVYILDRNGKVCPPQIIGSVVIRTPFPMLGYLNIESNAFRKNNLSNDVGYTLYWTGDKGKIEIDGEITILGREDQEIKINGVRINPLEIAAYLEQHQDIAHAYINTIKMQEQYALIAYIVLNKGVILSNPQSYRKFLEQYIPLVMVPKNYIPIEKIPLTPNGKIDKFQLPQPLELLYAREAIPVTNTEIILKRIWDELLNNDIEYGIDADFFNVGGHSLLAFQLQAKIKYILNASVDIQTIFKYSTIRTLAGYIDLNPKKHNQFDNVFNKFYNQNNQMSPLSLQQEGLWFLWEKFGPSPEYNMHIILEIEGKLDITKLKTTFEQLIQRHDMLRSSIKNTIDGPQIIIHKEVPINWYEQVLLGSEEEKQHILDEYIEHEINKSFCLEDPGFLRVSILHRSKVQATIVVVIHHIIGDGWSGEIFLRDFQLLYDNSGKEKFDLAMLPLQYTDYAIAQKSELYQKVIVKDLEYYNSIITDSPHILNLLGYQYTNNSLNNEGDVYHFKIPVEIAQRARQHGHTHNTTLYVVLMATFFVTLFRLTKQSSMIIGTDIACRDHPDLKNIIGFFVNILPIPINLERCQNFEMLVELLNKRIQNCMEHQHAPFNQIVANVQKNFKNENLQIFQHMFRLWNFNSKYNINELKITQIPRRHKLSKFDFTLTIYDNYKELRGEIEYKKIFPLQYIKFFSEYYLFLLNMFLEDSKLPLNHIPEDRVSDELKKTLPSSTYVNPYYKILESAKNYPTDIAIIDGEKELTYHELITKVDQLTVELKAAGLKQKDILILIGGKSIDSIIVILAAFNMKVVITPIDHRIPKQRQQNMIESVPSALILTTVTLENLKEPLASYSITKGLKGVKVDQSTVAKNNLPENAAYIFFTSGTTGKPKGIIGNACAITHFITWQAELFHINKSCRVAQLTSLSFDAILRDLFLPLSLGGKLFIPSEAEFDNINLLLSWLDQNKINIVHTVPSFVNAWLQFSNVAHLSNINWIFLSGEPLHGKLLQLFKKCFPTISANFVNFYGPSETTMIKSYYIIPTEIKDGMQPLGQSISETQICILNENFIPVMHGEVGEIYIRTQHKSLGYTDSTLNYTFINNPHNNDSSDILYKTGDLCRIGMDGNVYFVGRYDDQVKIRGVRIEPNEINQILLNFEFIQASYILVDKENDENILIAFIISNISKDSLFKVLQETLPSYSIPRLNIVQEFPLLPNGKVDRLKLLDIYKSSITQSEMIIASSNNETEQKIFEIWQNVLKHKNYTIQDNFFDVGGHSLLATLLVTRIRQAFNIEFGLREILQSPSISGISKIIKEKVNLNGEI